MTSSSPPPDREGARLLALPLHDLPRETAGPGVVRRGRGRPKKIVPAPTHDQLVYQRQRSEDRARHEEADPLVRAIRDGAPSSEVIYLAMIGLAEESAALLWDRRVAEAKGVDAALISTRRIEALAKLAALVLDLQRLGESDLVVNEGTFRKLRGVWLGMIGEVATSTLGVVDTERLLARYSEVLAAMRPEDAHARLAGKRGSEART